MELPEPPPDLPDAPARFYAALRARLADETIVWADAEDDGIQFGDAGVGITLTHVEDPDWVVAAQVSRVDALVFVGPAAHHAFDPEAAAALLARALRGEIEVTLRYRGDALVRVTATDADQTTLADARVGGPATWLRRGPETEQRRRMDYRA